LILTNLLWTNIYSVIPWESYPLFNGENRCGNYLALVFIIAMIKFLLCFAFAHVFETEGKNEIFEGTWTILCYTWLSFAILGAHTAEPLWGFIDKKKANTVIKITVYTCICFLLVIVLTTILYFIFTRLFYDLIIGKGLKIYVPPRYSTPGYWWAFSVANVYYTYWMMKKEYLHLVGNK